MSGELDLGGEEAARARVLKPSATHRFIDEGFCLCGLNQDCGFDPTAGILRWDRA